MAKKIRVTLLDDHQSILDGYMYRLGRVKQIEVVDTVRFGNDLGPSLNKHPTDVLLLDISAPMAADDPTPFPVQHEITRLKHDCPELVILVVSMYTEPALIRAVMEAGANGYILKDDQKTIEDLGGIILSVAGGGIYLSERVQRHLVNYGERAAGLSPRQLEALSLAASYPNSTTAELAYWMGIANSSIRNLLSSAYLKLGVGTRAAAIAKARQLGILPEAKASLPGRREP